MMNSGAKIFYFFAGSHASKLSNYMLMEFKEKRRRKK